MKRAPYPRSAASRRRRRTALLMLGGVVVASYFLAPFSWLVLTSVMGEQEAQEAMAVPPHWIPDRPTLANYATFVNPTGTRSIVGSRAAENTLPAIRNSLIAATGTAALNLALGTLAGYSFARLRFPGRPALLFLYLGSRMVPGMNPDIKVEYTPLDLQLYNEKMVALFNAGTQPDAYYVRDINLGAWVEAGWMQPIDGLPGLAELSRDIFPFNLEAPWYNEWDRYTQQQIQTALVKKASPRDALAASANKARELRKQWS